MQSLPSALPYNWKSARLRRRIGNYLSALVFVLVAQVGASLLLPNTNNMIFLLFCTAIAVSAIQGGFGPGIFATMLCAGFSAYCFLPPDHSFAVDSTGALKLILLCSTGVLISGQCERLHSARRAADRHLREIEEAQQRQDLLTQLGSTMTAATPIKLSLQNVALILTRQFADLCLIDIFQKDGELQRMAVSGSGLRNDDFAQQIALRYPVDSSLSYGPAEVGRTGRPEVIRRLNVATPHHEILESAGFQAYLSLLLYAPGRRLGVITLAFSETRMELRPEELALATEITRLISIRVANESLLWAAQEEIAHLKRQLMGR